MAIRILGEKHVGILMTESNLAKHIVYATNGKEQSPSFGKLSQLFILNIPTGHTRCVGMSALSRSWISHRRHYKVIDAVHSPGISNEDNARALGTAQVLLGP